MQESISTARDSVAGDRSLQPESGGRALHRVPGRAHLGDDRDPIVPGRVRLGAPELAARIAQHEEADAQAQVHAATASTGRPLPDALRQRFETSLGQPLGDVSVHDGRASGLAAAALGARAFAIGRQVHFGDEAGGASSDPHVLAHEVAHVAQQAGRPAAPQMKLLVGASSDPLEHEADHAADEMLAGRPASVTTGAAPAVRRLISVQGKERPRGTFLDCKWLGFMTYVNDSKWYYDFESDEALNEFIANKGECKEQKYQRIDAVALKAAERERDQQEEQRRQQAALERQSHQGAQARTAVDDAWQRGGQLSRLRGRMEGVANDRGLVPTTSHSGNNDRSAAFSATALTVIANALRQRVVQQVGPHKANIVVVTAVVCHKDQMVLLVAGNGGHEANEGLDALGQLVPGTRLEGIDRAIPVIDEPYPERQGSDAISQSGRTGRREVEPRVWHGEQKLIAYVELEFGAVARRSLTCLGIAHPDGPCHDKTFASQHCDDALRQIAERDPDQAVAAAWFQDYKPTGGGLADEVLGHEHNDRRGHHRDSERDRSRFGDKHRNDGERDFPRFEEKRHNDSGRGFSRGEDKHHNDSERDFLRVEEKHHNDSERNFPRVEEKRRNDSERNFPRVEEKRRNDSGRGFPRGEDKHRNDSGRGFSRGEDKHRNDSERGFSRGEDKHRDNTSGRGSSRSDRDGGRDQRSASKLSRDAYESNTTEGRGDRDKRSDAKRRKKDVPPQSNFETTRRNPHEDEDKDEDGEGTRQSEVV